MNVFNVCERCGKEEPGYDVVAINRKLKRIAKGPAGRQVEEFLCSRCVQKLVDTVEEEKENVPEASKARGNLVRKGFVRSLRPSYGQAR